MISLVFFVQSTSKLYLLLILYALAVQFPFFCSDREYIIGRRIWASGKTYYCVTKV